MQTMFKESQRYIDTHVFRALPAHTYHYLLYLVKCFAPEVGVQRDRIGKSSNLKHIPNCEQITPSS